MILTALGNHLWQSTLYAAMAGFLALALRKCHARVRYWVWLTASIKFLIPFSILVAIGSRLAWSPGSPVANNRLHFAAALILKKVPPEYPEAAKKAHIEGQVILRAIISKDGDVENLQIVSGHPQLMPSAIDAVKQWKYRPYLQQGKPVDVETEITVNFTLLK